MAFEGYETLKFDREGRVLRITMANGPMNAVDARLHRELARVFSDAETDEGSDLIILSGAGRAFSAGGDMAWFQDMIDQPAMFRDLLSEAKRIVFSLLELEKPIICRLNGAAAGLGATIALLCDVIIADEKAVIGDPHVRVGLVAGDGGAVIWPQLIGFARAKELLLTGDMLPAPRAAEMGLINYAMPTDELDNKVAEITKKILGNPRFAVRWTKTAANIALRDVAVKVMDAALAYEMMSNLTADRQEAVSAFVEKRAPTFSGE
jgi:enoyl-CoA hydratase